MEISPDFAPLPALAGGLLIGLGASLLLLSHGRIAGVSGILARLLVSGARGAPYRLAFVLGLVLAGLGARFVAPDAVPPATQGLGALAVAGLLVGYGARLANGCTSGHGICGLSRGSARSLVAVLTFLATGGLTVFVARGLAGVP